MLNRVRTTRFLIISLLFSLWLTSPAQAQNALPELPAPIQNLVDEGAQIRYLGREYGFDAWLTVKNGQEQYFYVLPDRSAFVMGVLFDDKGKLITVQQVQKLRENDDGSLDLLADEMTGFDLTQQNDTNPQFQSPSEQLYYQIENANWVPLGQAGAPAIYAFIDPQCPHCHSTIEDLKASGLLDQGRLQLRMIPVGFKDETRAQAAFLLATPNPETKWFAHMSGDENALPVKPDINQQGVQRNLAIMQSWKFNVTPMIIYKDKRGQVKLVRGRPESLDTLVNDLGNSG